MSYQTGPMQTTLDVLGDSTRRRILEMLRAEPMPVGAIAAQLPVTRPAVSKHLKVLKDAGLVEDEAAGTRRIYHVRPEGFEDVVAYWDSFWTGALAAFKTHAERKEDEVNETGLIIRKELTVQRPVAETFTLFTEELGRWWPTGAGHSVFGSETIDAVIEPSVGGRIYEIAADGREAEWGTVVGWDPPHTLSVRWHPGRGEGEATSWTLTLEPMGEAATRLVLVHTGWEARGAAAADRHREYTTGWDFVLGEFATHAR